MKDFTPSDWMDGKDAKRQGRYTQFAMAATKIALEDSKLDTEAVDKVKGGERPRIAGLLMRSCVQDGRAALCDSDVASALVLRCWVDDGRGMPVTEKNNDLLPTEHVSKQLLRALGVTTFRWNTDRQKSAAPWIVPLYLVTPLSRGCCLPFCSCSRHDADEFVRPHAKVVSFSPFSCALLLL